MLLLIFDDDVAAGASRASVKAAGVIVDDAAVTPGYVTGIQPERELPAYGVDSATGAFVSAEGAVVLAAQLSDDFIEELQAEMEAEYVPTREWALVPIPGTQGLNVATFSSGLGDGAYVSYWGFDAAGGIACLVTDFEIVGRPDRGARAPRGRAWWKLW